MEGVGESVGDGLGLAVSVAEGSAGFATGVGVRLSPVSADAESVASGGETGSAPEQAASSIENRRINPIDRIFMGLYFQSIATVSRLGPAEGGNGLL